MTIIIIKETRPGFSKQLSYSEGEVQFASMSRPSGDVHYIVAIGKQRFQLSKDFATGSDAHAAWQNGFEVRQESLGPAKKLIAEGIAEEIS